MVTNFVVMDSRSCSVSLAAALALLEISSNFIHFIPNWTKLK